MNHNSFRYFYLIIFFLAFTGCSKLLDKQPLDSSSTSNYWTSESDIEKAITGCYTYLRDIDNDIFLSTTTDDAFCLTTWPIDIPSIGNGSATTATGAFSTFWTIFYKGIAATNNVLDNIDKVTGVDSSTIANYKAQARFIRAYFYQQLIGFYGDVPLLTKTPSSDSLDVSKTSKEEIVNFILSELNEIADDLPTSADLGRVTKGAALGLKARVLLYNEQWADAAAAAKQVMDLGVYSIEQNGFLSIFDGTNKNSTEIILAATYSTTANSQKHGVVSWIAPPSLTGWNDMVPLEALADAYECTDGKTISESPLYNSSNPYVNRDPRLGYTIILPGAVVNDVTINVTSSTSLDRIGLGSPSGFYFRKYIPAEISGDWNDNSGNDEILMRYAEILLIYAEGKIEAGDIDQSVYDAINKIRERADVAMPDVTQENYSNQTSLRTLVRRERRVELALEPFRLFDIRRWKIADSVMNGTAYGIYNYFDASRTDYGSNVKIETRSFNASRDYLWAIPQSEIDINKNLVQNSGW
ncbi:MAG: RagB/SusD family nutrient uptake outer membrane protein [Arachidicoccus sp.]|nr:RagB/SusD family nutrient uptake outer membrane protein [Arachidicoccus sp.]